jgi:hypothetical protein
LMSRSYAMMRSPHCPAPDEPGAVAAGRSHWASGPPALLMVQSEAYASRERPAIFSLDCDRQSRERNLLMNNVHFMNEFYSSKLFRNPFYGDDG